ncbi:MAG: hypothetical protein U1F36_21825 [Planctomycetota bacterium]
MSEDVSLGIAVVKAGVPLVGATVSLAPPLTAAAAQTGEAACQPLFSGGTGDDGRCDASITLPAELDTVDVIVRYPGSTGAYTDEGLRSLWGPFAPSSRITVSVGALGNLTIQLEDA